MQCIPEVLHLMPESLHCFIPQMRHLRTFIITEHQPKILVTRNKVANFASRFNRLTTQNPTINYERKEITLPRLRAGDGHEPQLSVHRLQR